MRILKIHTKYKFNYISKFEIYSWSFFLVFIIVRWNGANPKEHFCSTHLLRWILTLHNIGNRKNKCIALRNWFAFSPSTRTFVTSTKRLNWCFWELSHTRNTYRTRGVGWAGCEFKLNDSTPFPPLFEASAETKNQNMQIFLEPKAPQTYELIWTCDTCHVTAVNWHQCR